MEDINNKIKSEKQNGLEEHFAVTFVSTDGKINESVNCKKNEKFFQILKKLYKKYPEYEEITNKITYNDKEIENFF